MKISTEIGSASGIIGEEKAVELVAKAGFDAWDFSMFSMCRYDWGARKVLETNHPLAGNEYLKFARKLKQIGLDNGIVCNQSHAPFPSVIPEIRSFLKRAIECTAEAGGKICIIHPCNDYSPEENAQMYFELLPFAKNCGVKIATENMFNWDREKNCPCFAACASPESFKAHIDAVNDDYLVACVDIGHAEMETMNTSAADVIRYLGKSVQALHIHDNDKKTDCHQIPFSMSIDNAPIIKALKDIDYKGWFTLEADAYLRKNGFTAENVFDGLVNMKNAAKKLAEMFENN